MGGGCCARFDEIYFRIKWRLHPSSCLATIIMGQNPGGGECALCSGGSWVPIEHKVAWAEAYLHTKCHLDSCDIKNGPKIGELCPLLG